MDDMLADLSPATTLEAFTSVSGTLKASIEAASPTQRAFGIRAAITSKKIQEWVTELSAWPWPARSSEGFEIPIAKRRRLSNGNLNNHRTAKQQGFRQDDRAVDEEEYWGCLPALDVLRYESRIEEISEDMDDLNVEEIKSQVLNTHVLPRSRATSLSGHFMEASSSESYTRMDDFTAVVTATVLQALPSLSRLMALMDMWSVRLSVLRQVSLLMASMEDAEVALRSGWKAIQTQQPESGPEGASSNTFTLSRQDYEIMRDVLQEKVSKLGQKLDHILDTLEGRDDALPEAWLDCMESIEQDYGEWVVCGETKVREGEWAKEISTRRQEKLRSSLPTVVDPPPSDTEPDSISEIQDNIVINGTPSKAPQVASTVHTENATSEHTLPLGPASFDIPIMEPLSQCFEPSLFDGPKDANSFTTASEDTPPVEQSMPQPIESVELTERDPPEEIVDAPSLKLVSLSPSPGKNDALPHREDIVTDLSSLSDGVSDNVESQKELMRSIDLFQPAAETPCELRTVHKDEFEANPAEITEPMTLEAARQILATDDLVESNGKPSTPLESSPSRHDGPGPVAWPDEPSTDDNYREVSRTPPSSSKIPGFEHTPANSLRKEMPREELSSSSPRASSDSNHSLQTSNATTAAVFPEHPATSIPQSSQKQDIEDSRVQGHPSDAVKPLPLAGVLNPDQPKFAENSTPGSKPTHIDLPLSPLITTSEMKVTDHLSPDVNSPDSSKGHTRGPSSVSIISGYATSEPSPVIYEAEPTEYFRPVSPPIIAKLRDLSNVTTPTRASFNNTPVSAKAPEIEPKRESETFNSQGVSQSQRLSLESPKKEHLSKENADSESSGTPSRRRPVSNDSVISVIKTASGQGRSSQEGSVSSEVFTINERLNSVTSTPIRVDSPEVEIVTRSWHSQFVSDYEGDSPSLGRVRLPNDANNYSPASSPPETPPSERRPLQLRKTPSFDPNSLYPDSPATPGEPPALSNVELSPTPALSSPSKHSDDQLQQQISEILESIPARIRLTSEPDKTGTSGIKQMKKRISLNPFSRPMSRAATPSFTLAPAYAKNPRPRPQNGNPEIKLYHLSRSTGEAPIKLFVRLVGENGERVMVRVGGGWADLGEYLKEYASHHGRRSDQPGKVEIQDLPARVVSTGSTASTSTLKNGTWNTSEASSPVSRPSSRPGSALGRPLSSLAIRKTRKSVGEEAREKAYRSPSTPLPSSFRSSPSAPRLNETPPSATSGRSVSQMSWREEESSLGLAGPRSRKSEISAENAAWVESMKEKVRIASTEKEKKEKTTFGDMGQVGATKRLFKRSG
jgi:hypothetical protein